MGQTIDKQEVGGECYEDMKMDDSCRRNFSYFFGCMEFDRKKENVGSDFQPIRCTNGTF